MSNVSKIVRNNLPPLAYIKHKAVNNAYVEKKSPVMGGMFCPGYMSVMTGSKAESLEKNFVNRNLDFLRFDYSYCGQSVNEKYQMKYGFKQWKNDVMQAFDELTEGPQILIGSSMGGWMSLLTALERPQRVAGVVLVAPSVDFTAGFRKRFLTTPELKEKFEKGEPVMISGPYGEFPIHINFANESMEFELLKKQSIEITCPVRIMHSMADYSVPYEISLKIMKNLKTPDVRLALVKDSEHNMSSESDLRLLSDQIESLFDSLNKK